MFSSGCRVWPHDRPKRALTVTFTTSFRTPDEQIKWTSAATVQAWHWTGTGNIISFAWRGKRQKRAQAARHNGEP
jgi:hypothetical protein